MSFVNPIDYTGFSSPFRADLVANNRNMAEAKKKAGNYLRAGNLGGSAASQFGKAVGQGFMDEAGAYDAAQQRGANTFSGFANAIGTIGGIGASGGFNNLFGGGAQIKGPSIGTYDWNTPLDIGGFTPTDILSNPSISYNPFGG